MPYGNMLENLIPHLDAWWGAITAIFYLIGFGLFLLSLAALAGSSGRGRPWGELFLSMAAGALLLNTPSLLDGLAGTIFGGTSVKGLSYAAPDHPARAYVEFAMHLIALLGLMGIGRGILILKDSPVRPGELGRAFTHIIGGILCVNLPSTLRMLGETLGGEARDVIGALTG